MVLVESQNDKLNFLKFAYIVFGEFPKALREAFKTKWDNTYGNLPGYKRWDDSIAVRNLFLGTEGGKTDVPTDISYDEWDCTELFKATIYARSFALNRKSRHYKTLSDLYVRPRKLPPGNFHASVKSPTGNNDETFALAIDQLRLLRNAHCHSSGLKLDRATFECYLQHAKEAFDALGITAAAIDDIGNLPESDFPAKSLARGKTRSGSEAIFIEFDSYPDLLRFFFCPQALVFLSVGKNLDHFHFRELLSFIT